MRQAEVTSRLLPTRSGDRRNDTSATSGHDEKKHLYTEVRGNPASVDRWI